MGVFGLLTYMKSIECGIERVNLANIARQYKIETGKEPEILVDISSCLKFFTNGSTSVKAPGNVWSLRKNLETFINNCHDLRIVLKFVFEGMKPNAKCESWIKKKLHYYTEMNSPKRDFEYLHFGSLLGICPVIIQSLNKCEYNRALFEADDFIINYAKEHGCFAILARDSDFILVEGAHYCLSIDYLLLDSMSICNMNRNNLAYNLKISTRMLPLFGALLDCSVGDAYTKMQKECANHGHLLGEKYSKVAKLVQNCPVIDDTEEILNHFVQKISMSEEQAFELRNRLNFYKGSSSLNGFTLTENRNWDNIVLAAEKRHLNGISEKRLLEIIKNRVFFLPPKTRNINHTERAVNPLRKAMYGIIFNECPDIDICVIEYTFQRNPSKGVELNRKPVRVYRTPHPGLLQLWSDDRSVDGVQLRLQLFCQSICDKLRPEILEAACLPDELLFPGLAVIYMIWKFGGDLDDNCSTALLTTAMVAYRLRKTDVRMNRECRNNKVFYITDRFLTIIEHLQLLNSICGDPYSVIKMEYVGLLSVWCISTPKNHPFSCRDQGCRMSVNDDVLGVFILEKCKTGHCIFPCLTCIMNYYDGNLLDLVYRKVTSEHFSEYYFNGVHFMTECNFLKSKLERIACSCGKPVSKRKSLPYIDLGAFPILNGW